MVPRHHRSRLSLGLITQSRKKNFITETSTNENETTTPHTKTTYGFKQRIMIGTWNVRTLSEPSRLNQVRNEMTTYNIDILGLSEIRWLQNGITHMTSGHQFLYAGNPNLRINGVGLLLSPTAKKALIQHKAISERLISARFRSKLRNITVLQCYAPTEPDDDETKNNFYELLETTMCSIPGGDIKILIGDFNAKVGNNNSNLKSVMGTHGLGTVRNDNGDRLVDLCARHHLFIGGTKFIHKNIHKYTWESPDGRTRNQIDHIMVSKLFLGCLLDVKTRRGADIDSDHHLLVGSFKLRPAAIYSKKKQPKYNIYKLQNSHVANQYKQAVEQHLNPPHAEHSWPDVQNACHQSASQILGTLKRNHKPWITDTTLQEIQVRKRLKNKINRAKKDITKRNAKTEYRQSAAKVRYMARADREAYYANISEKAEQASAVGNMRGVYNSIRQLSGKQARTTDVIKDDNGNDLTSSNEQLLRWREFFSMPSSPPNTTQTSQLSWHENRRLPRRDISTTPPTVAEVLHALSNLKNSKAPGPDNIPSELLKYGAEPIAKALTPIIRKIWDLESIPISWKEGIVVTIPKKGDLRQCSNWRGITLLNTVNKLLSSLILQRMSPVVETILRKEQAGFRPGRSCVDHINTTRIIIEQSIEYNSSLYLLFVDFERAFDTVSRPALWDALSSKGIPPKIIHLIRELYTDAKCKVRYRGEESQPFELNTGVKQGCVLSPTLFLLLLDCVLQKTNSETPYGIRWNMSELLHDIDYADDICLFAHRFDDIAQKIQHLSINANRVGLKINVKKTKLMRIGTSNTTPLTLQGQLIEDVNSFSYLGSTICKDGGSSADIADRINKARTAFHSLHRIWRANNITTTTKLKIFDSSVKSVLLYGCSTWSTTQATRRKLQSFCNKCLKQILRIFWPNWVTNEQLLLMANCKPIEFEICRRKWTWIGHILRRPPDEIARQALDWNPQGHRNPGRPRNTWIRMMKNECKSRNLTWNQAKILANDRVKWREFVDALCSS